jgi:hypothetical protein
MDMKKYFLIVITISLCLFSVSCSSNKKQGDDQQNTDTVKVTQLAAKYNAIDWAAKYADNDSPLTIDLQDELMNSNKPLLFKDCSLSDIYRKNGKIYASFDYSDNFGLPIKTLLLTIDPKVEETLKSIQENSISCALIIKVTDVVKPELYLSPSAVTTTDNDSSVIDLDTSDSVLIYGDLLDFVPLNDDSASVPASPTQQTTPPDATWWQRLLANV